MGKIRILAALMSIICILGLTELSVMAGENSEEALITEMNQVMTVLTDCDAREKPDKNSGIVMNYEAGASIWVTGESPEGWYRVSYQGKEGYVPQEAITELQVQMGGTSEDENNTDAIGDNNAAQSVTLKEAGLDTEMAALEAENELIVEEVERMRSEAKRSQIWKIVIAILVIGIFVIGIFCTVQSKKKKKNEVQAAGSKEEPEEAADRIEVIDLDKDEG